MVGWEVVVGRWLDLFSLFGFSIWLREEEENGNIYLRIALASNLTRLSFFFFFFILIEVK